jgi:hypothetical protein
MLEHALQMPELAEWSMTEGMHFIPPLQTFPADFSR